MQRPAQGGEPAAIELGEVQGPAPAREPNPMRRPDPAWHGPTAGYPPEPANNPQRLDLDEPVTVPPRLVPPPPWLARELDRPEPVTPAVPSFDSEPDMSVPTGRGPRRLAMVVTGLVALFLVAALVGAGVVDTLRTASDTVAADSPLPAADSPSPTADSPSPAADSPSPTAGSDAVDPATVAPEPATERLVTGPLGELQQAEFNLVSGTTTVSIRAADLGDDLYRIRTPIDADVQPRVIADGDRIKLHLVPNDQPGPGVVDIELHSSVRWQLRLTGGVAEHSIDLTDAELSGVDIVGGAARIELSLPAPDGTLPVRMTGGANQFVINAPDGPPAQVRFGSGAASATIDTRSHDGIAPGAVFTGQGWAGATDRYDIDAVAGLSVLTLQRN
ncbi:hypothetical protein ACFHWS_21440 [Micromonospora sp. LOL_013]|uniref:hypothetical protein n=1 Tax=Micromonospora sp. LOL_013 TaxID=3345414 RepID=UPI003A8BA1B4